MRPEFPVAPADLTRFFLLILPLMMAYVPNVFSFFSLFVYFFFLFVRCLVLANSGRSVR